MYNRYANLNITALFYNEIVEDFFSKYSLFSMIRKEQGYVSGIRQCKVLSIKKDYLRVKNNWKNFGSYLYLNVYKHDKSY